MINIYSNTRDCEKDTDDIDDIDCILFTKIIESFRKIGIIKTSHRGNGVSVDINYWYNHLLNKDDEIMLKYIQTNK